MGTENTEDEGVKDVDVVHIEPAGKDEENVETEETDADSPQQETEGDDESEEESEDADKPDQLIHKPAPADDDSQTPKDEDTLAEVDGETPRERALRKEVTRLKREARGERSAEIIGPAPAGTATRPELTDDDQKVLGKFKPEEIAGLREVIPVLAKEMGFVRKDELAGSTYAERAQGELDSFLDKHPEYQPENDKDGTLWTAFKAEYQLYNKPANPKDFGKIFDRVHREVFGIKPSTGALPKVNAQREKVSAASHAGTSAPRTATRERTAAPQGLRLDMLKGFDDDELAEIGG